MEIDYPQQIMEIDYPKQITEIDYPTQWLPERFEKTLKIDDEEYVPDDGDRKSSGSSDEDEDDDEEEEEDEDDDEEEEEEEDEEEDRDNTLNWRENYAHVAKDFLRHIEENQIAEFPWPPDRSCILFKGGYLDSFLVELKPEDVESVMVEDSGKVDPEMVKSAKRFLEKLRASWGYDVDCIPPHRLTRYFRHIDLQTGSEWSRNMVHKVAEHALSEINDEALKIGKIFSLRRIDNAVMVGVSVYYLLTLALKVIYVKDVEANAMEVVVKANVCNLPPCDDPKLMECKLVALTPTTTSCDMSCQ